MATITAERITRHDTDAWELPADKPLIKRLIGPWIANPAGGLGLIIVLAFILLGTVGWLGDIFGFSITPSDPDEINAGQRYLSPSLDHPFGTNKFGRDMFSRIMEGSVLSLKFSLAALVFGFIPGAALGIIGGYAGRWVDYLIQRSGEAWTSLPQLPILLAVIAAIGPGLKAVIIVIAIGAIFGGSRLLRAVSLIERHKEYIVAARSTGASELHILWRHVIPNVMPYILVGASSVFAIAIVAEATLSFLGVGAEQGTPGWGIDLKDGLAEGISRPYLMIYPGIVISIVVLGFNLLGDTLRDLLDPRLRGAR